MSGEGDIRAEGIIFLVNAQALKGTIKCPERQYLL